MARMLPCYLIWSSDEGGNHLWIFKFVKGFRDCELESIDSMFDIFILMFQQ